MINALFRTKFESNILYFGLFLGLNAFFGVILTQIFNEGPRRPEEEGFATIISWLLIIGVLTGGGAMMRHNREKRTRLYAELPVTPRQIRLAYWCLVGLFLFVSTGVFSLILFFSGISTASGLLLNALLYFVHAGTLMGVISIIFNNSVRLIPEEVRRHTVLYFFMAALLTFLTLFALGFLVMLYATFVEHGVVDRTVLTMSLTAACAGLVALDVFLFERKGNYLG